MDKIKRVLFLTMYISMPSTLIGLFFITLPRFGWISDMLSFLLLYLITLVGIVFFFFFKFHQSSFWALLLGLFCSWIYPTIREYRYRLSNPPDPDWDILPYVVTTITITFYVFPFIILSIIIFIFLRVRRSKYSKV